MGSTPHALRELYDNASPDARRLMAQQHPELLAKKTAAKATAPAPQTPTSVSIVCGMFVRVQLPIRLQTEGNTGGHWTTKASRAKAQREKVRQSSLGGIGFLASHALPLTITFVRIGPGTRKMDDDNLSGSAKHVRDEIARIIGIDDGDSRIAWKYAQRRGSAHAVEITIESSTK